MPSINVSLKKFTKSFDDVLLREEKKNTYFSNNIYNTKKVHKQKRAYI